MPTRAAATHALRKNLNPYVQQNRAFGSLSPVSFAVSKPQENATWGFSSRHSGQKPDDCQKPDFATYSTAVSNTSN